MAVFTPRTCCLMIPRTASTWVRDAIRAARPQTRYGRSWYWETSPKHRPFNPRGGVNDPQGRNWAGQTIYCFVRHPVTWLRSRWCLGPWDDGPMHVGDKFTAIWCDSFPAFVSAYLTQMPGEIGRYFEKYVCECTTTGKQETALEDLIRILRDAGETFDEPEIRNLTPTNFSEQYPDYAAGQAEAVCDAEAATLEKFGYTREWSDELVYRTQERIVQDYLASGPDVPDAVRNALSSILAGA